MEDLVRALEMRAERLRQELDEMVTVLGLAEVELVVGEEPFEGVEVGLCVFRPTHLLEGDDGTVEPLRLIWEGFMDSCGTTRSRAAWVERGTIRPLHRMSDQALRAMYQHQWNGASDRPQYVFEATGDPRDFGAIFVLERPDGTEEPMQNFAHGHVRDTMGKVLYTEQAEEIGRLRNIAAKADRPNRVKVDCKCAGLPLNEVCPACTAALRRK